MGNRNLRQSSEAEAEEADGRRKKWICMEEGGFLGSLRVTDV